MVLSLCVAVWQEAGAGKAKTNYQQQKKSAEYRHRYWEEVAFAWIKSS